MRARGASGLEVGVDDAAAVRAATGAGHQPLQLQQVQVAL